MTVDPAHADILESIIRLYPDRAGGSLTFTETALYLNKVHGFGQGNMDSLYEVFRRNITKLGIKVSPFPGGGKRIWVMDLVEAMVKLRNPEPIQPKVSNSTKNKSGFGGKRLDYANMTGPGADKGGVMPSPLFITKDALLVANPDGWHWRPQRQIPVVPVRTQFGSELAAVRYKKAQQRSKDFWHGVWREIEVLRAARRQEEALASPPTRHRVRPPTSRS